MDSEIIEQLKSCCQDEQSFNKVKQIVSDSVRRAEQAEEQLQLLESAIRDEYPALLITDLELEKPGPRIKYVNPEFERMTGYSKEEVIGKTPRILQGEHTNPETLDNLRETLNEGKSFFGKLVNYRKDGSEFVNQFDIHPLKNEKGEITHWAAYLHDVTDRIQAEQRVADIDQDYAQMHEDSQRTLLDMDLDGRILHANKAFRDLSGYTLEELKKMKVWDLLPEKFTFSLQKRFKTFEEQQDLETETYRVVINHKSGAPLQVEIETRILELRDRRVLRGIVTNITLQKRVVRKLREHREQFDRLFEKVTDFTYKLVKEEDGAYRFATLSENFPEITGFYGDKYEGKGMWRELIHPDDLDVAEEHLEIVFGGVSNTAEYRIKKSDGNYIKILDYARPLQEKNDEVTAVRGSVTAHIEES